MTPTKDCAVLLVVVSLSACNALTDAGRFRACPECVDAGAVSDATADTSTVTGDTGALLDGADDGSPPVRDARVDVIDPDDATVCEDGAVCDDHDACTANVCGEAACTFPLLQDNDDDKFVDRTTGLSCATDCNDSDGLVFPGQTTFFEAGGDLTGFDFDCNGVLERRWPSIATCGGPSCTPTEGWLDRVPECGFIGDWVRSCINGSGACVPATVERRTQQCR